MIQKVLSTDSVQHILVLGNWMLNKMHKFGKFRQSTKTKISC